MTQPLARRLIASLGVLFASAPLAVVGAFLLSPFWRWLEDTYGMEAYGHSGPAEWCYVASYLGCVVLVAIFVMLLRFNRRR